MQSRREEAEGRAAVPTVPHRPAHHGRRRRPALFARTRPELATPDVKISVAPFSADRPQDGLHPLVGLRADRLSASAGKPRRDQAEIGESRAIRRRCIPNYLATETDRRAIVDGLKIGRRILATPHMQHFIAEEYQPGSAVQTDEQLLEHAKQYRRHGVPPDQHVQDGQSIRWRWSIPNCACTASASLRVVDASIMPTVVSGNTNAATIMIGEKAADLVRQPTAHGGMSIYARFGVPTVINACGTVTRLSGGRMHPEVAAAMVAASRRMRRHDRICRPVPAASSRA